ncbi:MAG: DUF3231 family protein [Firmicutes bacterium]|nr:DUF3231 family protein [Bacillota bacterium]
MLLWKNYIHDPDLHHFFENAEGKLKNSMLELENELEKFGIKGPDKHRSVIKTATNAEVIRDETIAQDYYLILQEMIEMLLRAIRTSTTNDYVRNIYLKQLKNMLDFMDSYVKYLKVKGWLSVPPLYKNVPVDVKEKLDAGEAYHLWDHLTYRYDNLHQTDMFYTFAHDAEFKKIVQTGMQMTLKKQIAMLEKELSHFGIPVPKRPTNVYVAPPDTSLLDDDHMYRTILTGIQGAASLHGQAYKQCSTNDRIRKIFKELLFSEVDFLDKLIKFGKLKGWLYPTPQYRLQ